MHHDHSLAFAPSRRAAGFSLVEVLIALGIFAIGMTAIVSLFPAAAILQRETTQEVISEMAAQSARSIIDTQALTYEWSGTARTGDLADYYPHAGSNRTDVVPLRLIDINVSTTALDRYPAADRSYPTASLDGNNIADCDLHWVPFIQDLNGEPTGTNQNWVMRLFILDADSDADYSTTTPAGTVEVANSADPANFPRVVAVAASAAGNTFTTANTLDLDPGDIVMDSNGNSHVITDITGTAVTVLHPIARTPNAPNQLWYAPKFNGSASPAQRIVTVEVNVVKP